MNWSKLNNNDESRQRRARYSIISDKSLQALEGSNYEEQREPFMRAINDIAFFELIDSPRRGCLDWVKARGIRFFIDHFRRYRNTDDIDAICNEIRDIKMAHHSVEINSQEPLPHMGFRHKRPFHTRGGMPSIPEEPSTSQAFDGRHSLSPLFKLSHPIMCPPTDMSSNQYPTQVTSQSLQLVAVHHNAKPVSTTEVVDFYPSLSPSCKILSSEHQRETESLAAFSQRSMAVDGSTVVVNETSMISDKGKDESQSSDAAALVPKILSPTNRRTVINIEIELTDNSKNSKMSALRPTHQAPNSQQDLVVNQAVLSDMSKCRGRVDSCPTLVVPTSEIEDDSKNKNNAVSSCPEVNANDNENNITLIRFQHEMPDNNKAFVSCHTVFETGSHVPEMNNTNEFRDHETAITVDTERSKMVALCSLVPVPSNQTALIRSESREDIASGPTVLSPSSQSDVINKNSEISDDIKSSEAAVSCPTIDASGGHNVVISKNSEVPDGFESSNTVDACPVISATGSKVSLVSNEDKAADVNKNSKSSGFLLTAETTSSYMSALGKMSKAQYEKESREILSSTAMNALECSALTRRRLKQLSISDAAVYFPIPVNTISPMAQLHNRSTLTGESSHSFPELVIVGKGLTLNNNPSQSPYRDESEDTDATFTTSDKQHTIQNYPRMKQGFVDETAVMQITNKNEVTKHSSVPDSLTAKWSETAYSIPSTKTTSCFQAFPGTTSYKAQVMNPWEKQTPMDQTLPTITENSKHVAVATRACVKHIPSAKKPAFLPALPQMVALTMQPTTISVNAMASSKQMASLGKLSRIPVMNKDINQSPVTSKQIAAFCSIPIAMNKAASSFSNIPVATSYMAETICQRTNQISMAQSMTTLCTIPEDGSHMVSAIHSTENLIPTTKQAALVSGIKTPHDRVAPGMPTSCASLSTMTVAQQMALFSKDNEEKNSDQKNYRPMLHTQIDSMRSNVGALSMTNTDGPCPIISGATSHVARTMRPRAKQMPLVESITTLPTIPENSSQLVSTICNENPISAEHGCTIQVMPTGLIRPFVKPTTKQITMSKVTLLNQASKAAPAPLTLGTSILSSQQQSLGSQRSEKHIFMRESDFQQVTLTNRTEMHNMSDKLINGENWKNRKVSSISENSKKMMRLDKIDELSMAEEWDGMGEMVSLCVVDEEMETMLKSQGEEIASYEVQLIGEKQTTKERETWGDKVLSPVFSKRAL